MPDGDGYDICRKLRSQWVFQINYFVDSKGAENAIALGLEAGANNYAIKPLRMVELIALIRSVSASSL